MKKHPIPAKVCRYILLKKNLTYRALARGLQIHHSTLQRYLKGLHEPEPAIKQRMAKFMKANSYLELVKSAFYGS